MVTLAVLLGIIDGASEADIEVILPPAERRGDLTCAYAIDYGTPGHWRAVLRRRASAAAHAGRGKALHDKWMQRLAARATAAIRAGRPLALTDRRQVRGRSER